MYAQGNVCLSNIKDEFLYAEELYWNQKTKKVYSEKFVKIETPDEVIYGEGFESDEEFTSYVIKKIKGSYTNVVGLSLSDVYNILMSHGFFKQQIY